MSKFIGDVSAYAYAVSKGYTGTEEEFAELMASYADVGQTAVDAKDAAVAAKTAAQTAATTATNKASEATTAATTATTKASEASTSASTATSAKDTAVSASQTATSNATEATTAATSANTAKTDAVAAKTAAETAQGKAEDAQAAAEAVAESIPSDYSQLSEDVSELKEKFNYNFPVENLIPLSSSENTFNDVTITCENGVITPSGTATAPGGRLAHIIDLPNVKAGTYTLSAFPTGTGDQLMLHLQDASNSIIASVKNGSNTFTLNADSNLYIGANVAVGETYSDPVGVTLVSGSNAPTEFIDPRKRSVVDITARNNYEKTVHIMDSNGSITDANDAEINRIYSFINVSGVSNLPVANGGTLITFARSTEVKMQMYMSSSNNLYIRSKWGTNNWFAWRQLITDYSVSTSPTSNMMAMPNNDGLTDVDDAIINRVYLLINVANVSNLPKSTAGILITSARDSSAVFQMYITSSYAECWFRRKWGTNGWSAWKRVATIDDIPSTFDPPLDVLPMYDNITCVGDSLTYSQVYTADSASRQAKVPYPKVLEKITGTPTTMYATAGYTAIQWWNAYHENITQKTNQVAIVYLGTNAGLTDTIDTDASGMDVANYDKTTNTGAYCSIVKSFLDVGAKVILVKLYSSSGNKDTTNSVIKKIADKFSCGLVESVYLADNVYHYYPDLSSYNSVHYNDIGYSAFARKLSDNITNMDKDYLKFIIPT